ncbi:MAG: YggS family pyridoxal phosphate-dependent enzyme [Candidatus Marinimicrobia bacterium]|nr:YggS family pyridoxal phosphate-dependent enzyme [Candidatus Neomarinimicrobiota bacterium]|tara:strand:+ start:10425 stop:11126 length:702 start_codon:yes stop_codon:yes gene_type:complete
MVIPGSISPDSIKNINKRIRIACEQSGRHEKDINIVAVTKSFGLNAIISALSLGIRCIGENKSQEVEFKVPQITNTLDKEIHFIGHLQSNKVRKILNLVDVIETVDSLKLANKINNLSKELKKRTKIFLQVNTGNDPKKYGFNTKKIVLASEKISQMDNLYLSGIMTIPPRLKNTTKLKDIFNKTRKIRDEIQKNINPNCKNLSMGMSADFEIAIKCGATHIRLGTILFGKRD